MAFELDDLVDNMHGALRFFLAHLDGLRDDQWDWKAALEEALARPAPDVAQVQALFEAAARRDYARLRRKYADTPLDAGIATPGGDWFLAGRP